MNAALFRSVIHIAALCAAYLSSAMALPALADLYYGDRNWQVFALSGLMTGGLATATVLATRGPAPVVNRRFSLLLVNVLWAVFSLTAALPFYLAGLDLSFAKALFEATSAVTASGATALAGLDDMPPGILLWRSLLCWFGGIGIVALGLFVLPFLKVGGASMFKLESSDINDRPFARMASFTRAFIAIYVLLTLACILAYALAGMNRFDALNHALATVSTAGFSTHDLSLGFFEGNRAVLLVAAVFLIIGSLPFSILVLMAVRGSRDTLKDPQIRLFLGYVALFSIVLAIYQHLRNGTELDHAMVQSFFAMASIFSTGGFTSEDYTTWGPLAVVMAFFATFAGGCSGSTAGGVKAYRFVIMFNAIGAGLKRLVYPNAVQVLRYGRLAVDADTQRGVLLFVSLFLLLWAGGSAAMAAMGHDFATAVSSVLTCLANVGPGIGPLIGPAGNYAGIDDPALYLLSFLMLLGRLEILTVLVLMLPAFWRR